MLKRKWAGPILKGHHFSGVVICYLLLGLLPPMIRMKLLFWASSVIIRTICLLNQSFSCLLERSRCQTVSQAAVSSTSSAPVFFCLKCVLDALREQNKLIYGGLSPQKPACLRRSTRSMKSLMEA